LLFFYQINHIISVKNINLLSLLILYNFLRRFKSVKISLFQIFSIIFLTLKTIIILSYRMTLRSLLENDCKFRFYII